jgi:hypothetical protein
MVVALRISNRDRNVRRTTPHPMPARMRARLMATTD